MWVLVILILASGQTGMRHDPATGVVTKFKTKTECELTLKSDKAELLAQNPGMTYGKDFTLECKKA